MLISNAVWVCSTKDENSYLQVFLKEWKYIEKEKMKIYIYYWRHKTADYSNESDEEWIKHLGFFKQSKFMCTKYILKIKNIDHLSLKKKSGYALFLGNYLSNTLQHNIFCSIGSFYRLQLRGHHKKEKSVTKYVLLHIYYYNYIHYDNSITITILLQ